VLTPVAKVKDSASGGSSDPSNDKGSIYRTRVTLYLLIYLVSLTYHLMGTLLRRRKKRIRRGRLRRSWRGRRVSR